MRVKVVFAPSRGMVRKGNEGRRDSFANLSLSAQHTINHLIVRRSADPSATGYDVYLKTFPHDHPTFWISRRYEIIAGETS